MNNNFRYADIKYGESINGQGTGVSIYVQGCKNYCKNCFNKETWDFNGGKEFTPDELNNIINYFYKYDKYIHRLSLLGGDPLWNIDLSRMLVQTFKNRFPNKKIWLWTGFTYEEILKDKHKKEILEYIDVIVDGKYIDEEKDLDLLWRGSKNQLVIDVKESLNQNRIIKYID